MSTATNSAIAPVSLKDMRLFREANYVDGQWVQATSGATCNVDNPATGEIIGKVPKLSGMETRRAIEVANQAFPLWAARLNRPLHWMPRAQRFRMVCRSFCRMGGTSFS